jgi:hypothetical protein
MGNDESVRVSVFCAQVRPINLLDFREALTQVRASVSGSDLESYMEWNAKYGSVAHQPLQPQYSPVHMEALTN